MKPNSNTPNRFNPPPLNTLPTPAQRFWNSVEPTHPNHTVAAPNTHRGPTLNNLRPSANRPTTYPFLQDPITMRVIANSGYSGINDDQEFKALIARTITEPANR